MPEILQKLVQLGVFDAEPEPTYDRVCRLARRASGAAIATVSFFDGARHWLKARENYQATFVSAEQSFCSTALLSDGVFWVENAAADDRFKFLDAVVRGGLRFYAAAPVRVWDGRRIGNVCVLDPQPRAYDPELARDLIDLAEVVSDELALKEAERRVTAALADRTAVQVSQGRLLSILSHELRTPLNGAVGAASLLSKAVEDRGARELVAVVAESCGKLERLVESLLAFTVAQEDEQEIAATPCDVRSVLSDAVALVEPTAARRGVTISRAECDLPPAVSTDGARLGQIIFNLLSNAVQHADGGLVKVEAAWREPDRLSVSVTDTGVGVAPERLASLFEPFNRDLSNTDRDGGLGLGLATTRRLAVRLGGDVYADSGPAGSVFRVEIAAPRATPAVARPTLQGSGGRAMIVDDHPANLLVQSRLLEALGLEAEAFDNAEDALARAALTPFDLVLTDINMPGVDGYGFVERLRAAGGWRSTVPVFAVSASLPPSGVEREPPPGFTGWLTKPLGLEKLQTLLASLERVAAPPLWRLLYVSRARAGASRDVEDITVWSQTENECRGVTGVLAAWSGWYVQVLEGDRVEVDRIFSRIARDERHTDVALVSARACGTRRFAGWSMIAAEIDDADQEAVALLRADAATSPAVMSESALLLLLELAEQRAAPSPRRDVRPRTAGRAGG